MWIKIAKYLFNYKSEKKRNLGEKPVKDWDIDVTTALEILKDSILKIDDMLPLFPEEAKVEDMKDHLCNCLDDYN